MPESVVRSLIDRLRELAEHPAPTPLPSTYVDGFTDGFRAAANILEALLNA